MFRKIDRCRVCENTNLVSILDLGEQALTGVFPQSATVEVTSGPLELVKCWNGGCGLVQLRHSFDSAEMYGEDYGYRSSLNRSMVEHLRGKVQGLLARYPVAAGGIVLDIGSNDGTLLSFYPGELQRVGMDPTAAKFRGFYEPSIQVVEDFFSQAGFQALFGEQRARIVTSIAMFYDLEEPLAFVRQIAAILADDGIWHFEQSYLPAMLHENAYDTVCHEHLEYYGLEQIQWMLERCGLRILEVERNAVNGGSFAVTAAKTGSAHRPDEPAIRRVLEDERAGGYHTLAPYAAFRERVMAHRDELLALLDRLLAEGANILGYGASTKGNVILQFCGITAARLPCIAEVNRDKFGHVTPGTHIPIVSEQEAHAQRPDYFLVMPWHFRENLLRREAGYLERGGKMIFPLPAIEILSR